MDTYTASIEYQGSLWTAIFTSQESMVGWINRTARDLIAKLPMEAESQLSITATRLR